MIRGERGRLATAFLRRRRSRPLKKKKREESPFEDGLFRKRQKSKSSPLFAPYAGRNEQACDRGTAEGEQTENAEKKTAYTSTIEKKSPEKKDLHEGEGRGPVREVKSPGVRLEKEKRANAFGPQTPEKGLTENISFRDEGGGGKKRPAGPSGRWKRRLQDTSERQKGGKRTGRFIARASGPRKMADRCCGRFNQGKSRRKEEDV